MSRWDTIPSDLQKDKNMLQSLRGCHSIPMLISVWFAFGYGSATHAETVADLIVRGDYVVTMNPSQEVIEDGATGLLVRPGDSEDIVEKIELLRYDSGLRETMGIAASQEARNHTWERNARLVMALADPLVRKG